MRHVNQLDLRHITDPDTGRTYPIPMGGADDGGGGGEGEAAAEGDAKSTDAEDGSTSDDADTDGSDDEGAGSKTAILRDLATERDKRQELEAEVAELRQQMESDDERREREAREREEQVRAEAQAPALQALRAAAIETAAREAGFIQPGDAATFLRDEGHMELIDVDLDTATTDRDKVVELIGELAERKPHLVVADQRPGTDRGGSDFQQGGGSSTQGNSPNDRFMSALRKSLAGHGGG